VLAALRQLAPHVLVCMGYAPGYNLLAAAAVRIVRAPSLVVYMSDMNGVELLQRSTTSISRLAGLAVRRAVLSTVFASAFDLGASNALAHQLLGIRNRTELPLLSVVPPDDPSVQPLPAPVQHRLSQLAPPRVGCASRLVPEKNLVALCRAWSRHVAAGGAGSLAIAGAGPLRAELEHTTSHLPPDRFALLGALPYHEARRFFLAFEASVLASVSDQWGIAVVESLMAGVPVLATPHVGAAWSLLPSAPGAIVLVDTDEDALCQGLGRLLSSLSAHRAAAAQARAAIGQQFAAHRVANRLVEFARAAGAAQPRGE
jgi:glycosyltransferase involved in cell wall biosynthesis